MSLKKKAKQAAAKLIPSPIVIDFEKGGAHEIMEVAPYPKEVFWDDSVEVFKTVSGWEYVRTPEERFDKLPDYPFTSKYIEIDGLRMHYLDEGDQDGEVILMLHGQPVWNFLYRKMIKDLSAKGYRCIAPDMIGMGKDRKSVV